MEAYISFKADIFNGGVRPTYHAGSHRGFLEDFFYLTPHYPQQFFRNFWQGQRRWPDRGKNKSKTYITQVSVSNVEVSQKRSKYKEPCTTGFPNNDHQIIQWITNKIGCNPPYWKFASQLPLCSSKEELQEATTLFVSATTKNSNYTEDQPCRGLEKIQFDTLDIDWENDYETPWVQFQIIFDEFSYKEVKSVRSMDEQTLIGNITPMFTLQYLIKIKNVF